MASARRAAHSGTVSDAVRPLAHQCEAHARPQGVARQPAGGW